MWLPVLSPPLLMIMQMVSYIMYWGHWNPIYRWCPMTCIHPRVHFFHPVKISWESCFHMAHEQESEDNSDLVSNSFKKLNKDSEDSSDLVSTSFKKWNKESEDGSFHCVNLDLKNETFSLCHTSLSLRSLHFNLHYINFVECNEAWGACISFGLFY